MMESTLRVVNMVLVNLFGQITARTNYNKKFV